MSEGEISLGQEVTKPVNKDVSLAPPIPITPKQSETPSILPARPEPSIQTGVSEIRDSEIKDASESHESIDPTKRMTACVQTLENVSKKLLAKSETIETDQASVLGQARDLLHKISQDSILSTNPEVAKKVVAVTIALLDTITINEIEQYSEVSNEDPAKAEYYRETGKSDKNLGISIPEFVEPVSQIEHTTFFLTPEELNQLENEIKRMAIMNDGPQPIEYVEDLSALKRRGSAYRFYASSLSMSDIVERINSNPEPRGQLIPFRINEQVAGVKFERPNLYPGPLLQKLFYPRSELPRQEIWQAFLDQGYPLFSEDNQTAIGTEQKLPEKDEPITFEERQILSYALDYYLRETSNDVNDDSLSEKYHRRKAHVGVDAVTNPELLASYLAKHKEHIGRVMGREHSVFGKPEVLLTRSGVSANETAINTVASVTGLTKDDRPNAYTLPGFYYENEYKIDEAFHLTDTPGDARVFFANHDSSNPEAETLKDYDQKRDTLIAHVIESAKAQPQEKYYLILDKTTNPIFATFAEGQEMPPNLSIIETASLTKNQRGGKHYFFGAALYWGDKSIKPVLEKAQLESRGSLTPWGIVQFPRITRSEIERSIAHTAELNVAIAEAFVTAQAEIPENQRWQVIPRTRFDYILPPLDYLKSTYKRYLSLHPDTKFHDFLASHLLDLKNIDAIAKLQVDRTENATIELGDSFGLEHTRLTRIWRPVPTNSEKEAELFKYASISYPRISPGTVTSPEEMRAFTEEFVQEIARRTQLLNVQSTEESTTLSNNSL